MSTPSPSIQAHFHFADRAPVTGYFGQNFEPFPELYEGGISYFWKIAPATLVATILLLMSSTIWGYFKTLAQRRRIFSMRRIRKKKLRKQQVAVFTAA